MEPEPNYFKNPNTIFNKAAWFEKDCEGISLFIGKTKHSIGWDGKKYIVFIHSNWLVWLWHRHVTGKFQDVKTVIYEKRPDMNPT